MTNNNVPVIDYDALVSQLVLGANRRIVTHDICLNPGLYTALEEARQEVRDERLEARDDEPPTIRDRRLGGLTPLAKAEARLADITETMRQVSVRAVFHALPADEQAKRIDQLRTKMEKDPTTTSASTIEENRAEIYDCFHHFEDFNGNKINMDKSHLISIVGTWGYGEVMALGDKLGDASLGRFTLPKFEPSSPSSQPSGVTSGSPES